MKRIGLLLVVLGMWTAVCGQSVAHQREARFGKGANLSNWLEAYWMGSGWPQPGKYQRADLQAMKDAGMSTVRVPFCFAMITDTLNAPYVVDFNSAGIAWLDSVIDWTGALGMNLIICNQHGWDVTNGNYQSKIAPMSAMWTQVATHYAGLDPEHYFFEMLNEPPVGVLPANADAVNQACIDAVRQVDTVHTLVVGPHTASIGSSYLSFSPYADPNLIYTFHTYEPLYFTHQGFTWMTPQFPTGVPFPFLGDDALLRGAISAAVNWRDTNGLPVFMGEFGVGIYADADSRCNWIALLGDLVDQHQLNALAWDWGGVAPSDFSMFDALPPSVSTMNSCFAEAMHFYEPNRVQEAAVGKGLRLWPNPSAGKVWLEAPKAMAAVEWVDAQGRVAQKQAFERALMQVELATEGLQEGVWLLRVHFRDGSVESRVLVRE
ncbi:MAG: glycoside hydrolase family 5 protein [Bacteroidia bacterium]